MHGERLRGERLVHLEHVDLVQLQAGLLQHLPDGRHRADAHDPGLDARVAVAHQAAYRLQAVAAGVRAAGQHDGGRRVVHAGGVPGGDRALLGERRAQPGHGLQADVLPEVLVGLELDGLLLDLDLDGRYLLVEVVRCRRGRGPAVALDRQRVLILAGDVVVVGHVLRRYAHVAGIPRVVQRADHRVDGLGVAHPLAPAHVLQPVRATAHRLGPAGYRDLGVTQHDELGGRHDGLQPAAAQPVDGEGGHLHGEAAVDRGDPAQVHVPGLGVNHVAEDHVPEVLRIDGGPAYRLADHRRRQVTRRDAGEGAAVPADGRPGTRQHHHVVVLLGHNFPLTVRPP